MKIDDNYDLITGSLLVELQCQPPRHKFISASATMVRKVNLHFAIITFGHIPRAKVRVGLVFQLQFIHSLALADAIRRYGIG